MDRSAFRRFDSIGESGAFQRGAERRVARQNQSSDTGTSVSGPALYRHGRQEVSLALGECPVCVRLQCGREGRQARAAVAAAFAMNDRRPANQMTQSPPIDCILRYYGKDRPLGLIGAKPQPSVANRRLPQSRATPANKTARKLPEIRSMERITQLPSGEAEMVRTN